jgi:5-(carboxyamino)imidazole ribonucleotide synthase
VPVAPFAPVDSLGGLVAKASIIGYPCVLKTTQGGYDGKGQWLIEHPGDVETVWADVVTRLAEGVVNDDKPALSPLILETYISFQMELSVVVARTADGQTKCFPVSENVHDHHVLHLSIVPARITEEVANTARSIASRIAESLDLIGVLAVELFLTEDGQLYVNELAPRPHNSGHYTGDACVTSQFEQHVRAVCNLPLGDTKLLSPVVMVNILGKHLDAVMRQLPHLPANMKLHLYGKQGAAPRRKMGHINVLADTTEEALGQIESMAIW